MTDTEMYTYTVYYTFAVELLFANAKWGENKKIC